MRTAAAILAVLLAGCGVHRPTDGSPAASVAFFQFTEQIPGTALSFDMMPVRGDPRAGIEPFWIGRTEVTWDVYDVFVYGLDEPDPEARADAVTRPSKPYVSMDRGFGHAGHPAISMSHHAAQSFCRWLSGTTGRRYRLPTEDEWRLACTLGAVPPAELAAHAWYRDNADSRTHPVATRAPDALGLHDLHGNASEWCTGPAGEPVTLGGCYLDGSDDLGCADRRPPSASWNQSDPQLPKSVWWLADAGFVGFRLVCEP